MRDVWVIPTVAKGESIATVPSQKPEALIRRILELCSKENQLVFDPFCGAGSLPVVASKLNRRWIAVEKDVSHWEHANLRLNTPSS